MLPRLLCFCLMAFATCCAHSSYDGGRPFTPCLGPNGKVVLRPICDESDNGMVWNWGQEMRDEIRDAATSRCDLYVLNENSYYLLDHSIFPRGHYVAEITLQRHDRVPYERQLYPEKFYKEWSRCDSTLFMQARLTITTVRQGAPLVILDETIKSNFTIPKDQEFYNYRKNHWGTKAYRNSAFSQAHRQFARVIADRLAVVVESSP